MWKTKFTFFEASYLNLMSVLLSEHQTFVIIQFSCYTFGSRQEIDVEQSESKKSPMDNPTLNMTVVEFWKAFCQQNPHFAPDTPYQVWYFGDGRELADELCALVLAGKKTATAALGWELELEPDEMPQVDGYSVITDFDGNPQCILQTVEVRTLPFDQVDAQFAAEEGEGDLSLEYWRQAHWRFFSRACAKLGRQPELNMLVVCERFRLVYPKN
jgi:uncharacterized protein YhfF